MRPTIIFIISLIIIFLRASVFAQLPSADNSDGTFTNPVLRADYPDPDIIRVGDDYYFASSSFHFVPGDPIFHSKDLVNWQIVGHAIPSYDPEVCGRRYNMIDGNAYGFGSWAPSIRFRDGVFYVCYWIRAFDEKKLGRGGDFYVSRATNPAGPWTINKIEASLYDPGLFFDDDGRVYVIHGQTSIYCTELTPDLKAIKSPAKLLFDSSKLNVPAAVEGSHVYKVDGYYYIFTPCGSRNEVRWGQMAYRSKSIYGPYESKLVFEDNLNWPLSGAHQGALIQTQQGKWWAILFQGHGKFGRIPVMLPVDWQDGWPILTPGITFHKPVVGKVINPQPAVLSDDFSDTKLGLQWQWNHNPDKQAWSLSAKPSWLRLNTSNVVSYWAEARNTLTQPIFLNPTTVITKLDISHMQDGDFTGLGVMQLGSSYIAVTKEDSKHSIIVGDELYQQSPMKKKRTTIDSIPIATNEIYFRAIRSDCEFDVQYAYSLDGKNYTSIGKPVSIEFILNRRWMGMRYGIFNYATKSAGGFVDFDFVQFDMDSLNHNFTTNQIIQAERFDAHSDTQVKMCTDEIAGGYDQSVYAIKDGGWIRFDNIDLSDAGSIEARLEPGEGATKIELRLDTPVGKLIGSIEVGGSKSNQPFETIISPIDKTTGKHLIYFVYHSTEKKFATLSWIRFCTPK